MVILCSMLFAVSFNTAHPVPLALVETGFGVS